MARIRWRHLDPWSDVFWDMGRLQREMNRLFEGVWPGQRRADIEFPALNIWNKGDDIVVSAELPGVKADEIELSVTQNALTIKGERKAAEEKEGSAYHRRERKFGPFVRSIELPEKVDANMASASYENGVLTIALPKAPEAKPKQISVKG
ncbi:MAG: Hsp20/alpha crystallin family protein [Planctomycetota bacterium]